MVSPTEKVCQENILPVLLYIHPAYAMIKEDEEEETALRKITLRIILRLAHACHLVRRRQLRLDQHPGQALRRSGG
jgi:UV DNA damage repair endonuclease